MTGWDGRHPVIDARAEQVARAIERAGRPLTVREIHQVTGAPEGTVYGIVSGRYPGCGYWFRRRGHRKPYRWELAARDTSPPQRAKPGRGGES